MGRLCADDEGDCGDGWREEVLVDGEENDGIKLIKSERSQKHSDSSRLYLDKLLKHIICI